jgi:hypothetical protein
VSGKTAEFVKLPLVPVTVMVEFPMYVEELYAEVSVSVAVPTEDVVIEAAGENLAVTPAGRPLIESATVPLKPYHADAATV